MTETFASRLRRFRHTKGLTQDELGKLIGVSYVQISHWEADRRTPRLSTVILLAKALGISTDELLGVTK